MYLHDDERSSTRDCGLPSRMDPRSRLLCAGILTVGAVLSDSLTLNLAWYGLSVVLLTLSGVAWRQTRTALVSVNLFMLFIWLTLPLTMPGTFSTLTPDWMSGLGLSLSEEGLRLAMQLTLKANTSMLFLLAFCGTLDLNAFGSALQGLGVPAMFVTLFILVCRHLFCLRDEFRLSLQALRLRASEARGLQAMSLYACLVGSVLVRSADRAEMVRMALLCKPGPLLYTSALRLHWTWKDTSVCGFSVALCLCVLLLGQGGVIEVALAGF